MTRFERRIIETALDNEMTAVFRNYRPSPYSETYSSAYTVEFIFPTGDRTIFYTHHCDEFNNIERNKFYDGILRRLVTLAINR